MPCVSPMLTVAFIRRLGLSFKGIFIAEYQYRKFSMIRHDEKKHIIKKI